MTTTPNAGTSEIDDLRRELDALRGQLDVERTQRSARTRRVFTWILTTLAVLATVLSLLSIWTLRTLTNTDLFVDRVGSIIEQPAVAQQIGERAAAEIVVAADLQQRIAEALPPEAAIAAGPIASAAQGFLADGATELVETEQFQQAWDTALTASHRLAIGVLAGEDTTALTNEDGAIVLNLTPVVNALVAQGSEFLSQLLNRQINAPTLTTENLDDAAAALEQALGVELPVGFGDVTLFTSDDLAAAQQGYAAMRVATWLTPLVALMLIGLALAVSLSRLRTLLTIVVGVALLLLLVGLALNPLENQIISAVADQGLQGAVRASFGTVTSSLLTAITVVAVLGVLAALALFTMSDSRSGRAAREAIGQAPSLASRYRGAFLGGGAVVALVLLAIIPGRSFGQLLFVLVLYAGYALAVLLAPRRVDAGAPPVPLAG
jgi:hypothetical protein